MNDWYLNCAVLFLERALSKETKYHRRRVRNVNYFELLSKINFSEGLVATIEFHELESYMCVLFLWKAIPLSCLV